jgi:hypothetical protein
MNKKLSLAIFSIALLAFAVVGVVTGTGLSHDAFATYKKSYNNQQNFQDAFIFNNPQPTIQI